MSLLSAAFVTAGLRAQLLPEGYDSAVTSLPPSANNVLTWSPGLTIWFDGTDLVLDGLGQHVTLLRFAVPVFGSFTLRADPGHVLFGESSMGNLWLVPVNGNSPTQPLANLPFNFDAVMLSNGIAIVSAKTGGFGSAFNDLHVLDLQTGNTQQLAMLPGASGPVAVDRVGDLWYATASQSFPTPSGQTDLLRFPRALVDQAIANQQVLGSSHAHTVVGGLDSASDLEFDNDGDLLFVDWYNATVGEIDDARGPNPTPKVLVDHGGTALSAASLAFREPGNAPSGSVFEPFQPTLAGDLFVHETTFGTLSQLRTIRPHTATLTASAPQPLPAGPFTLQVADGPANGTGLIAIGLTGVGSVAAFPIAGFEQPAIWDVGLLQPANTWFVSFDATGRATLPLANPGFAPALAIAAQSAFLDAAGVTIGATAPAVVLLGP
ncbi:MAG: hypothetical protein KDE27_11440 [Planctomycetes bacterium]|nr:hypothetical protein [Planctomycetota bacterium]